MTTTTTERPDVVTAANLDAVPLLRRHRHFVVASTGAGKSTLCAALLEDYHRRYPDDWLYLLDPKKRFHPTAYENETRLFPDGWREMRHGRRDAVSVEGRILRRPDSPHESPSEALIIQDVGLIRDTLTWLYDNASVETPAIVFADETRRLINHVRAIPEVRMVQQEGREIGLGSLLNSQEARYIDPTFFSESEVLYISGLYDPADRDKVLPHIQGTPLKRYLEQADTLMPRHRWLYINREDWARSSVFDLRIKQ